MGLDPGKFWGIAILDLHGNVLRLETLKNPKKHEIIDRIMSAGHPSVFATDVARPSASVRQIASAFGCRVIHPDEDMAVSEKNELAAGRFSTLHERDALAAAVMAFRKLSGMFAKADRVREADPDMVKDLVLRGEASNIAEAVKMLKPEEIGGKVVVKVPLSTRAIGRLTKRLDEAESIISSLKSRIKLLEAEIRKLRNENEKLKKNRQKKIVRISKPEHPAVAGMTEVIELADYSRKTIYGMELADRVVMFKTNRGSIKLLKKLNPKLVIVDAEDFELPYVRPSDVHVVEHMGKKYVSDDEIGSILENPEWVIKRFYHERSQRL